MAAAYKDLTNFLRSVGIDGIAHTEKTYLGHLVALYHYLTAQGFGEDVARAGMFHSIYGTERFQGFTLPLERRAEVRELIGERPERLAYLNCAMDRASFDRAVQQDVGPYRFRDRISGETVELSAEDFDDLARVHLYDWLEQAPRASDWDYRRAAYRRLADRLGSTSVAEHQRVYALETANVS